MSELPVDTNQEEYERTEQMQEEIDAAIEEEMQEKIDAVIEGEKQMAEFDNEGEVWKDTSRRIPKGATPIDRYTKEKDDNAGEFWFPPSRNCSCCKGFKYGCECTNDGEWDCQKLDCETSSAEEDLSIVKRDVVENDRLRHTPVIVYRSSKVFAAGGAPTSVPAPPPEQAFVPASVSAATSAADTQIKCNDCFLDFIHTGKRKAEFERNGWSPPIRCAKCNDQRKQGVGQPRHASSSTSVSVPAPGYASASVPAPVPDPVPVPAPVPDPVPVPVPVPDVVRTGPVTPENIGDIASGTPLYQGKNRKLLIVIRYNPDSGFIFLQDGEKPPLKMKLVNAGLFWDNS